jgi:hypothetical protein
MPGPAVERPECGEAADSQAVSIPAEPLLTVHGGNGGWEGLAWGICSLHTHSPMPTHGLTSEVGTH